jgi:flagellar basal-body rod protein FlgB
MIDQLSTVTSTAVGVALDALAQRQQLIAANLANANSARYELRELRFEDTFRRIVLEGGSDAMQSLLQLRQELRDGAHVRRNGNEPVRLDAEMLRLNETVIRYQALIAGLGKYGSLARMAISGEVKG